MTNRFCAAIGFSAIFLASSCGTNKKLASAEAEANDLKAKNAELTSHVGQLTQEISDLTNRNDQMTADFVRYRKQCEGVQDKYRTANNVLKDQETILRQLDEKLEAALADLEGRGLSVHYKRGLLFVSMEDQLLFKTGSAKVDKGAFDALAKIAGVVNDYPDVKLIVVGNTDDKMFKGPTDNWTLSTERANSVVRILRDSYSIDPARMTSAGRGKFNPVADNSTEEGRAKNRRIDIIFNPDLDKVWDSIEL
jgi:chemotaxis protein MotB